MKYKCVSADSHLEIRPDRCTQRVPEKFRDRAPKVIALEDGALAVLQEGQPLERLISNLSCGAPYGERRPFDPLPGEPYVKSPGKLDIDKLMWASDFPHLESDWPNSRKVIAENFAPSTEEEMRKMTVGNAVKYFRLSDR